MATRDPQKHGGGGINATTRRRRRRAHLRAVVAGSRPMAVPAVVYLSVRHQLPGARANQRQRLHRDIAAEGARHRVLRGAHAGHAHQRTQVADAHGHGPRGDAGASWESAPDADGLPTSAEGGRVGLRGGDRVRGRADGAERVRVDILRDDAQARERTYCRGRRHGFRGAASGAPKLSPVGQEHPAGDVLHRDLFADGFPDVGGANILGGVDAACVGIACLHASGGVLVALSVLHSSSVTKTVAVCASLVLTTA